MLYHSILFERTGLTLIQITEPNTVWLCGDSTMAPGGGHNEREGWGQYLQYSLDAAKIRVNNSAYAGRSARVFTREGRFQDVFDKVQPRDWAVIEFGHNDGHKYMFVDSRSDVSLTVFLSC